jgi:hypothetical protein
MKGKNEKHTQNFGWKTCREEPSVDGKITLEWILRK